MTVQFASPRILPPPPAEIISYGPFQFVRSAEGTNANAQLFVDRTPVSLKPVGYIIMELLISRQGYAVTLSEFAEKLDTPKARETLEIIKSGHTDTPYSSLPLYNILKVHMSNIRSAIIAAHDDKDTGRQYANWFYASGLKGSTSGGAYKLMEPEGPSAALSENLTATLKEIFTRANGHPLSYGGLTLTPGAREDFSDAELSVQSEPRQKIGHKNKQIMALLIDAQDRPVPIGTIADIVGRKGEDLQTARQYVSMLRKLLLKSFSRQTKTSPLPYIIEHTGKTKNIYEVTGEETVKLAPFKLLTEWGKQQKQKTAHNIIVVSGIRITVRASEARLFKLASERGRSYSMEDFCRALPSPTNLRTLHEMESAATEKDYNKARNKAQNLHNVLLRNLKCKVAESLAGQEIQTVENVPEFLHLHPKAHKKKAPSSQTTIKCGNKIMANGDFANAQNPRKTRIFFYSQMHVDGFAALPDASANGHTATKKLVLRYSEPGHNHTYVYTHTALVNMNEDIEALKREHKIDDAVTVWRGAESHVRYFGPATPVTLRARGEQPSAKEHIFSR